jgi:hypothetical protein
MGGCKGARPAAAAEPGQWDCHRDPLQQLLLLLLLSSLVLLVWVLCLQVLLLVRDLAWQQLYRLPLPLLLLLLLNCAVDVTQTLQCPRHAMYQLLLLLLLLLVVWQFLLLHPRSSP